MLDLFVRGKILGAVLHGMEGEIALVFLAATLRRIEGGTRRCSHPLPQNGNAQKKMGNEGRNPKI